MMAAIYNQLGLCVDEYIVKLIAISSDRVSMDVDGGFDGRLIGWFNGGFYGWLDGGFYGWFYHGFDSRFNLAVLGY